jgi:AcrR family transcriptional regulator
MVRTYERNLTRKEQIVNAARKLVIKCGSENVTIRRIAGEVGVSEAAIYRHFKSKREILYLLVESIEINLISDLESQNRPEYGRLENVLLNHLSALEMRRGISFQVIAEIISLGDKKLNNRIYETIKKYIARFKELLLTEIEKGEVRGDIDVEAAAVILFSIVQGLSNIWTLSNYSFNPKDKFDPILNVLRRGLT